MIRIRYSPGEYEVSGSVAELAEVAAALRNVASGDGEIVIRGATSFDPKPYTAILPLLRVAKNGAKDRVTLVADSLVLSGSEAGLRRLASFFEMPDDAKSGFHVHHEFVYAPQFIACDSLPLVIAVEEQQ